MYKIAKFTLVLIMLCLPTIGLANDNRDTRTKKTDVDVVKLNLEPAASLMLTTWKMQWGVYSSDLELDPTQTVVSAKIGKMKICAKYNKGNDTSTAAGLIEAWAKCVEAYAQGFHEATSQAITKSQAEILAERCVKELENDWNLSFNITTNTATSKTKLIVGEKVFSFDSKNMNKLEIVGTAVAIWAREIGAYAYSTCHVPEDEWDA